MQNNRKKGLTALVFLTPGLLGMLFFGFVPIIYSLIISLTSWRGLSKFRLNADNFIGLKNYVDIFKDSEIWRVLSHNAYFIVLYLPLMIIFSLLCAGIIASNKRRTGIYRVLYYIPVLTSWVAGALIWKWVLSPEYGPINNILKIIGIKGPLWLQSETWAMPSIVIASIWKDMGFYAMIFLGGLLGISSEYYEAAQIDGASKVKQFFKITLPLLSPITFYVVKLALINAFQLFPQIMVMTTNGDAGPNGATQVMVERIYKYAFKLGKMGYAAAYSWILFVIIFSLTAVQNFMQKWWVHYE